MTKELINIELDKIRELGYSLTVWEQNQDIIIFNGSKFEPKSEEWIKIKIEIKSPKS